MKKVVPHETPNINKLLATPAYRACSKYGADMGRRSQKDGKPERLHLQRLRFIDQCYDVGGAYWGMPANLYCAFSPDNTENDVPVMVFARGANREEAKKAILAQLPGDGWKFYR